MRPADEIKKTLDELKKHYNNLDLSNTECFTSVNYKNCKELECYINALEWVLNIKDNMICDKTTYGK